MIGITRSAAYRGVERKKRGEIKGGCEKEREEELDCPRDGFLAKYRTPKSLYQLNFIIGYGVYNILLSNNQQ